MLYRLLKRKYMLFSSNMSRKSWAWVSGLTLFIKSSDAQWMESDRWLYRDNSCSRELGGGGVKMGGGCNEVQTGVWPPILPPQRLEFLTRSCWACWYGNTVSAGWGRYAGITLVLEKKWYTYAIHAIKAKIHAFQQQHVTQVMGLSFWSHPFYNIEWTLVLEKKWYTYVIHAKKAKIHASQQQHVMQVMGLSFWSHPFYNIEWSPVDGIR